MTIHCIRDMGIEGEVLPILTQPVEAEGAPPLDVVGLSRRGYAVAIGRVGYTLLYSPGSVGYRDPEGNTIHIGRGYRQSTYALVKVGDDILASEETAPWAQVVITDESGTHRRAADKWPYTMRVVAAYRLRTFPRLTDLKERYGVPWHGMASYHEGELAAFADLEIEPWVPAEDGADTSFWRAAQSRRVDHGGRARPSDFVYAITSPLRPGLLKIGCAIDDARARLVEARRWLGPDADFALPPENVGPGLGEQAETALHTRFSAHRVDGEWFRITPKDFEAALFDLLTRRRGELPAPVDGNAAH